MKIQQVKEYNAEDLRKWHRRVEEWKKDKFTNNIIPQIAFVGFRKENGEMKQKGYVVNDEKRAFWANTKKEAMAEFNKLIK